MTTVTSREQLGSIPATIVEGECEFDRSSLTVTGKNNYLFFDEGVVLKNSSIAIRGDNNAVYLSRSNNPYLLNVSMNGGSALFVGPDTYMNGRLNLILSERKHVIIGADCLLSFGIWVRLADPHLIYDAATKHRINPSKSVFIGDHCWVGQDALVLKGTTLGSGSILAARAVSSSLNAPSNSISGGVPARVMRENVFFERPSVHGFSEEQTEESMVCESTESLFYVDDTTIDIEDLDARLDAATAAILKMVILKELADNTAANRFAR